MLGPRSPARQASQCTEPSTPRLPPAPQLEPVPCKTTKQAFELRETQMTDIQKQIREDTTRFRWVGAALGGAGWRWWRWMARVARVALGGADGAAVLVAQAWSPHDAGSALV